MSDRPVPTLLVTGRRLLATGARTIGILPAHKKTDVWTVLTDLAGALEEIGGGPVARIPSWTTWADADTARAAPAATVQRMEVMIHEQALRSGQVLVDLTGVDPVLAGTMTSLDGVALVARAGRTWERRLRALAGPLPAEKRLGVLLVD